MPSNAPANANCGKYAALLLHGRNTRFAANKVLEPASARRVLRGNELPPNRRTVGAVALRHAM
jgi:hypothetical protein